MTNFQDTVDWYNSHADAYAKLTQKNYQEERINKFVSMLKPRSRILDAGCASGRDSKVLSKKGFIVNGIDASEKLIKIAKKNVPAVMFITGNFLSLPFSSEYFDGIWAHASMVHMESQADAKKALKEFNRVLLSNGLLYLFLRTQKESGQIVITDGRFYRYFSENEITTLLKETGFTTQEQFVQTEHDRPGRKTRGIQWMSIYAKKSWRFLSQR